MARYAKKNGVAQRDIGDGITIVAELDPELRWVVTAPGSPLPSDAREQMLAAYREMLEATAARMLDDVGGKAPPQFGTTQGYVFAHTTALHRFTIVQNPEAGDTPEGIVF